ncbi:MAG: TetR/AcrR family transcriptional regulator [Acidimicrobiia bacterium]
MSTAEAGVTAEPRSRHRKGEGEQLRREILDATRELLAEKGNLDLVSIRGIAARVGVTPPSIYLHFKDKDHLGYSVCREAFESFGARLLPVLTGDGNAVDRLRRLGEEYVRWGLDNAALYPVLFIGGPPRSIEPEEMSGDPGLTILEGLVALVRSGMDEGLISTDHSPEATAWALWAVAHGTVLLLISKMEWVKEHLENVGAEITLPTAEAMIETAIDGLSRGFFEPATG